MANPKGRPRKPHAIKVIEDSRWKDTDSVPKLDPAIPTMPNHILKNKIASQEWKRVCPLLKKAGLLTLVDRAALSAYCSAWALYCEAEKSIQSDGIIVVTSFGLQSNPAVNIAQKAMSMMAKYLTEFGMSPSSRTRVAISGEQESGNSFDDLLSKN